MDTLDEVVIADLKSNLNHGILVARIVNLIARDLDFDEDMCYEISLAGMLHDIGKLALARYLYGRKTDSLKVEEMQYMRMHSKMSYDILQHFDFSYLTLETVLHHHECYDGSGYPDHLEGEDIPVGARILKVADSYAALISDRPYRKAFSHEMALQIMIEEHKELDMEVFLSFMRIANSDEFQEIINDCHLEFDGIEEIIGGL